MSRKKSFLPPKRGKKIADRDQEKFDVALTFHQDGNLRTAGILYEEILKRSPDHLGALHLSALICFEEKRPDLAEAFLRRAIMVASDVAPIRLAYGVALFDLGRFEEAVASYDKAISIDPYYAEAFYNRANALKDLGRYAQAIGDYAAVIAMEPGHAQAFSNQGDALQSLRRFEEALVCYAKAISLKPDWAEAYSNLGLALHEMKRFGEALSNYDQAIASRRDFATAYFNRGNTLKEIARFDEAVADYAQALMIEPENADAYSNQGDALQSLGRFAEALTRYDKAISVKPDFPEAHSNRGVCLKEVKQFEEALRSFDQATHVAPGYAEAWWNKALTLLLMGRFEAGWDLYEWRKKARDPAGARSFNRPVWLGQEDIANKTLLVHAEQGFGDAIQFARYLPGLNEMGAKVLFAPHGVLGRLMGTLDATVQIVKEDDSALEFDYHVPLMSLPLVFKTDFSNLPSRAAYLRAEEPRVDSWKKRLGPDGFKVGICWQGSRGAADVGRSFCIRQLFELSQIPGLRLISLQKGDGASQLLGLPQGMVVETLGADFDAGPDAFVDTAAVMKCCDLVITSDTAVAHLAGALGVKTWVALKHVPDWRWFLERDDSPWYPSIRLFRQPSPGDWDGVFARMKAALVQATPSVRESGSAP